MQTTSKKATLILAACLLPLSSGIAQQTPPASTTTPAKPKQSTGTGTGTSTGTGTTAHRTTTATKPKPLVPVTDKDKQSYAVGINVGKSLRRDQLDVEPKFVYQGIQDALADGKLQLTDDQIRTIMTNLQTQMRQKMEEKRLAETEGNKKEGAAFLAANATKPGVVTLPSGLQYKILTPGSGPKPTASDSVVCNYRGSLLDHTEFDSSYKRGQPATFPVGGVIKGWTEALQLMPVGSKWQLFIPADLAYGDRGQGPIGPNSTLVFEVELVSIKDKDKAPAQ
jgi:FKBP-type peptidyl-prolyl cis-trans isomerase FklB